MKTSIATAMIVAMLQASTEAVNINSNSQLGSQFGFNFGNLVDKAASSVTDIAGGNDALSSVTNQVANVQQAVQSGDASQVVNTAGSSLASNVGGDFGNQIGQVSNLSAGLAGNAQAGNAMGLVGGSVSGIGALAGGPNGQMVQGLGGTIDFAGNQAIAGNLPQALTSTSNQIGTMTNMPVQFAAASNMANTASTNGVQGALAQANPQMAAVYDQSKQVVAGYGTNGAQGVAMNTTGQVSNLIGGQAGQNMLSVANTGNSIANQDLQGATQAALSISDPRIQTNMQGTQNAVASQLQNAQNFQVAGGQQIQGLQTAVQQANQPQQQVQTQFAMQPVNQQLNAAAAQPQMQQVPSQAEQQANNAINMIGDVNQLSLEERVRVAQSLQQALARVQGGPNANAGVQTVQQAAVAAPVAAQQNNMVQNQAAQVTSNNMSGPLAQFGL